MLGREVILETGQVCQGEKLAIGKIGKEASWPTGKITNGPSTVGVPSPRFCHSCGVRGERESGLCFFFGIFAFYLALNFIPPLSPLSVHSN